MYPRNAASPERIAIGVLVQISDGAVQTSGETITTRGHGAAETVGDNAGVYGASGMIYYTPSQAETDFTSFVVIASKTGCIPVAQTIVTSAASVPGQVDVWGISGDATAADNAESFFDGTGYAGTNNVIPTVTTATNVTNVNDKTGYSLTATTGLGNQTSNITGNLSGSVGSVTGAVGSVTGAVASVTGAVGSVTGAVGSVTGAVGSVAGNVNGSVATLTTLPTIPTNWLTADGLATDAVTEIINAVYGRTLTEPTGVPAWSGDTEDLLNWLLALARNKVTQDATTQTLRNDADNADIATSTVSDSAGTFTRNEWS